MPDEKTLAPGPTGAITFTESGGQILIDVDSDFVGGINYYEFAFPPTASDDGQGTSGRGPFAKGDVWRDSADDVLWMAASVGTDAAVWVPIGYADYDGLTRQTLVGGDRVRVRTAAGAWRALDAYDIARAQFIRETVSLSGSATDIDVSTALQKALAISADTLIDFINIPASGQHWEVYATVTQDGTGGHDITHAKTVTWRTGQAPDFTDMEPNQVGRVWYWGDAGDAGTIYGDHDIYAYDEIIRVAISSETEDAATGTGVMAFRMAFAGKIVDVRLDASDAPTGSAAIVDLNNEVGSVFSTRVQMDAGEDTSVTAATGHVISDADFADNEKMTVDIDQVGSTNAGKGFKLTVYAKRTG